MQIIIITSGRDSEDNTNYERSPGTLTDIGAQNLPSATTFSDIFKFPWLQIWASWPTYTRMWVQCSWTGKTNPMRPVKPPSADGPAKSEDMDFSALLTSAGKDGNNVGMPWRRPSRRSGGYFSIFFCQKRRGMKSSRLNLRNIPALRMSRVCEYWETADGSKMQTTGGPGSQCQNNITPRIVNLGRLCAD